MARTNDVWETGPGGGYIQTIDPAGFDILINGSNHYINFGLTVGPSGYGFRDNAGTMEFKNSGGSWAAFGGGGGGSQTPWLSDIDADGYNIFDLGDIEFRGIGELKNPYTVYTLGSTTFHGAGKNNLTFTGIYTGSSTPTYSFTVTHLDAQVFQVDDTSNIFAGDSVTGDTSGVGTVLYVDTLNGYIAVNASVSFAGDVTIDDTTTSTFGINIQSGITTSDTGTFTDGTTTYTDIPMAFQTLSPITINGVTYTLSGITNRNRLHTVTNFWTAPVTSSTGTGDAFYSNLNTSEVTIGDRDEGVLGNIISTDKNGTASRWRMKDKNGTYFSMQSSGQLPTFSGLGGSGADRFVGLDNNGTMSNVASPLSIGSAIGGVTPKYVLIADNSGNLATTVNGNSIFCDFGTGMIVNAPQGQTVNTSAYQIFNPAGKIMYSFDLGTAGLIDIGDIQNYYDTNGAVMRFNMPSKTMSFNNFNDFTMNVNGNFTLQDNAGNPAIVGSLVPGAIAFQLGDLLGTGQNTYLSITDANATMKFAANDRFFAGASNASQTYLDLDHSAGTYGIGATNFGNNTRIVINDTTKNIDVNGSQITLGDILGVGAGGTLLLGGASGLTSSSGMDWDFGGGRLETLADPVNPQDAMTLNWFDTQYNPSQYETPTTGSTVTFGAGIKTMTINPAGTLLALTIAFPASPFDGQICQFNVTQAITGLTLSGGTFVGGLTTVGVGGFAIYVFSSGDNKWHRQG